MTIDTGAVCRSLDCTGYTGTITHTAGVLWNIGDGTAGLNSNALIFVAAMTYNRGVGSTITFVSTSATAQNVNFASKTGGLVTFNGTGGSWKLTGTMAESSNSTLTLTAGTLTTNAQTCGWGIFSSSGALTRTLDITNTSITISGTGTSWQCGIADPGGLTLTSTGSTITQTGAGVTFNGGAKTYNNIVQSGSGAATMNLNTAGNTSTLATYTRTPTAVKTDSVIFRNSVTTTGAMTLNSNSVTNRLLVQSITLGTPVTLTAASLVCTNVIDFQDITGAGAATWTTGASGATYFGDCGGNSGITTTTPATQTATGTASFTWSTHGWTSRVPLPQDNVVISNAFSASQTITVDMPRIGANITASGATGAPAFSWAAAISSFGNLTMAGNVVPSGGTSVWTLAGRGSQTIINNGVTWGNATRMTISPVVGTYTLQDAYVAAASASPSSLTVATGTFADGGFNITTGQLVVSGTTTYTAGNITFTANGTSTGNMINITSANANMTNMTVSIPTRTVNQNFSGGGKTYKALNIVGGTGVLTMVGANTFTNLPQITGGTQSIVWPGSTTTTFTNGGNFGNGTNVLTFTASAGSATLSFGTQVNADYLNLTNIPAAGTTPAYAGTNSTNGGGNTNWLFSAAPTTVPSSNMLLMGV